MAVTITPALGQLPAASAPAAPHLSLQAGSVVSAQVLQALQNGLVQVAIDGIAIAAFSEVALQPGQTLQLAVSQAQGGMVRLRVLPRGSQGESPQAASGGIAATGQPSQSGSARPASALIASAPLLDPEIAALGHAVQLAAPKQQSLSPLYANLAVITTSGDTPSGVRQGAAQLLAQRPELSAALSADDLHAAFRRSGLFLESSLASGAAPNAAADLKAALATFRSALVTWLGPDPPPSVAVDAARSPTVLKDGAGNTAKRVAEPAASLARPANLAVGNDSGHETRPAPTGGRPLDVPASAPAKTVAPPAPAAAAGMTLAASPLAARSLPDKAPVAPGTIPADTIPADMDGASDGGPALAVASGKALAQPAVRDPVQAMQAMFRIVSALSSPPPPLAPNVTAGRVAPDPAAQTPPPFRGTAPSAQAVAAPSLPPEAAPLETAVHLLRQTEAALARQTLLQVASLPDRIETMSHASPVHSAEPATARWCFEIPFATSQGTAVAQFEIEQDGGGETVEAAKRIFRARFCLDIEPTGPVHALVSLVGEKTAVRLWAERPETAAQMRGHSDQLMQALRAAALQPAEIAIAEGLSAQAATVPAGHFLDRAS